MSSAYDVEVARPEHRRPRGRNWRRDWQGGRALLPVLILATVLAAAWNFGRDPGIRSLLVPLAVVAGYLLLRLLHSPDLWLPALILVALFAKIGIKTGTEVDINPTVLFVPLLVALWCLRVLAGHRRQLRGSPVFRPLIFFLVANLFSLVIGQVTWDPLVSQSDHFLLVQLAQWSVFAFSGLAFYLAGEQRGEWELRRLVFLFLGIGGALAVIFILPGGRPLVVDHTTLAVLRPPFWMLLSALAAGQLLFNNRLSTPARLAFMVILAAAVAFALGQEQDSSSTWVGIGAALGTLVWLRFPRLRLLLALSIVVLAASGVLFSALYRFAGGDAAWAATGGSRLVLIQRVVEVTMRNPITGLGPAGYRPYANATPLKYMNAYWLDPLVNSHNNYVDLFAHGGIVGLVFFGWFAVEVALLGVRLRRRFRDGFAAGYVNSALAAGAASLVLMAFADWILPFVYNIGFNGFQASLLVWLFVGGLVALDHLPRVGEEGA